MTDTFQINDETTETHHFLTKQTEVKNNSCIIMIDEKEVLTKHNKSEESTDSDRGVAPHKDFYDLSKFDECSLLLPKDNS